MVPTTRAGTIGTRLAQVAGRLADRSALVERASTVTYAQLDAAAARAAFRLVALKGDAPGRVVLFFENRIPAICAMYGAARSGHAYVPLDAGDPEERLRAIIADCEPLAILTEAPLAERARAIAPRGCAILDVTAPARPEPGATLPAVDADRPVYLYYTSGSTGEPKGTVQTHRNQVFLVDAYARALAIGEKDRLSLLYTLSFNASNLDIHAALLCGATLCALDVRSEGLAELADWLDRERITVLHTVPTVFREFCRRIPVNRVLPHLRAIVLGGEVVFASDVDQFRAHTLEGCRFVNQLASTETGLTAQYVLGHGDRYDPAGVVPVGRCIDGVEVEVLRSDGKVAAAGERGEIVVRSAYISPGYWRRPGINAASFSADERNPGWRAYRSGDLGFVDVEGNLHFQGRHGSRVKLRGHSIDLMEVEAALSRCPGISKSAVLLKATGGREAREQLVAYVVTERADERDVQIIRRRLAARIPKYMLPSSFIFLEALPLTASGKIDRNALAAITLEAAVAPRAVAPPRDALEHEIARIFGALLAIEPIARDDDFFLLGGDSLLGVELLVRLRSAFGIHVDNLHEGSTVARIAARIRKVRRSASSRGVPVLVPLWRQGRETPLFLVHGRHGQAFVSPHFMRLLGNEQPVWAFQARGLDGTSALHSSVEAMAAEYCAKLRDVRRHGPYFIGALCAGAYVAAVIARTLRDAGEIVLPLLLLDPPERLLRAGYAGLGEAQFTALMSERRAMGGSLGPTDDPTFMKSVYRVAMAFEQAIARYRPQPYDGPAFMLSSRERIEGSEAGLRQIFSGDVRRYVVGSTHTDSLDPRNPVFASYLARVLSEIRAAAGSRSDGSAPAASGSTDSVSVLRPAVGLPAGTDAALPDIVEVERQ